jgi:hypothetical protein
VTSPTTVSLSASGNYTFDLTCAGIAPCGSVSAVQKTVAVSQPTTLCSARPAPVGLTRQTDMRNTPFFAENGEFNSGANIPLTGYSPILGTFPAQGQTAYVFIDTSKYIALQFSTAGQTTGTLGELSWEQPTTNGAPLWVMISECPGDFEWMTDAKCKVHGGLTALTWVVGPASTAPTWACHLAPNTTYYVNAVFSATESYTTTTCGGSNCHWFINRAGRSLMDNPSEKK